MRNMKTTFIYALCEPFNIERVRYIGKSDDPQNRYKEHLRARNDYHVDRWIRKMRTSGYIPKLRIIMECPFILWKEMERHWINIFKSIGESLTNIGDGGLSGSHSLGRKHSPETIAKLSAKQSNRTKEHQDKLTANHWTKNQGKADEIKARISDKLLNRRFSNATLQKMSKSAKGRMPWNKGKKLGPLSDKQKNKLSIIQSQRRIEEGWYDKRPSSKDIISDIWRVSQLLDKTPSFQEYQTYGNYGTRQVLYKFSKWTTACKSAGLVPNSGYKKHRKHKGGDVNDRSE